LNALRFCHGFLSARESSLLSRVFSSEKATMLLPEHTCRDTTGGKPVQCFYLN
jgi:hypothetical protein